MLVWSSLMTIQFSSAQQIGPWVKLGEKAVSVSTERDVIRSAHKGFFSKLKIHVKNNPIEIKKITAHFLNGTSKTLRVRGRINAGSDSRIINLPGNRRIIREIVIYHKAQAHRPGRPPVRPPHRPSYRPGNRPSQNRPIATISVWAHR